MGSANDADPAASVVTVPMVAPSSARAKVRFGYQPARRTFAVSPTKTPAGSRLNVPCRMVGRMRTTCGSWSDAWSENSALLWMTW